MARSMMDAETHALMSIPGYEPDTLDDWLNEYTTTSRARNKQLRILTSLEASKSTSAVDDDVNSDSAIGSEVVSPVKKPTNSNHGNGSRAMTEQTSTHDLTAEQPVRVSAKPRTPTGPKRASMLDVDQEPVAEPTSPDELTTRGIHVPSRTSSSGNIHKSRSGRFRSPSVEYGPSLPATPDSGSPSKDGGASMLSNETPATSINTLPPLQAKNPLMDHDQLEPLLEDDPSCYDLVAPTDENTSDAYSLEKRADLLFSREHLATIFEDPVLLSKFTAFLTNYRANSVPMLVYYLDAVKAIRAINYANAVAEALEPLNGQDFTQIPARPTVNSVLEDKAEKAFQVLVNEDLPAYVAHVFVRLASLSVKKRVTGTLTEDLRQTSEGLAEVFCLTDPSRPDNPIVFASEEFHRTTQYGTSYVLGRNCRFLQGPNTSRDSVRRLAIACSEGKEIVEVFLNYRRDGSPFMNLLMMAPLLDSRGDVRYFLGAQVDVSGLVKNSSHLEALKRLVSKYEGSDSPGAAEDREDEDPELPPDEFRDLCEMLNIQELDTVKTYGGRMHKGPVVEAEEERADMPKGATSQQRRLLLKDRSPDLYTSFQLHTRSNGRLAGVYENYLLVRPHPSLRILFASPSLRTPGMLQSSFFQRIAGSQRVRDELSNALAEGRGVTAKVRWLAGRDDTVGRPRWVHCTPLTGTNQRVGVWMVVLVDDETENDAALTSETRRKWRAPPPVAPSFKSRADQERRNLGYDTYKERSARTGAGEAASRAGYRADEHKGKQNEADHSRDKSVASSNRNGEAAIFESFKVSHQPRLRGQPSYEAVNVAPAPDVPIYNNRSASKLSYHSFESFPVG